MPTPSTRLPAHNWFLLLLPFVGLLAFGLTPQRAATMEFYSTVAQVIPVLILVLAIETRFFELAPLSGPSPVAVRGQYLTKATTVLVLILLLDAEFQAVRPLLTGELSDGYPKLISMGLATGFLAVAVIALAPLRRR